MKSTKIVLYFFLPLLALILSGCSKTVINQHIGSDGTIVFEEDLDFEDYIKASMENASSTNPLEQSEIDLRLKDISEGGDSYGEEICKSYSEDTLGDDRYIFSNCLPGTYGAHFLSALVPGAAGDIKIEGEYYSYNVRDFLDFHEMTDMYESGGDELPESLQEGFSMSANLYFEGEVVSSDIGEISGNKVSFSHEDIEAVMAVKPNPIIKARKKATEPEARQLFIDLKLNKDGSGYINYPASSSLLFAPTKQWGLSGKKLEEAYCGSSVSASSTNPARKESCSMQSDLVFFKVELGNNSLKYLNNQENNQYYLVDVISFQNLNAQQRAAFLENIDEYSGQLAYTLNFYGKIIRSDVGQVNGNQLVLSYQDLKKLKADSQVIIKAEVDQTGKPGSNVNNRPVSILNKIRGKIVLKVEGHGEAYYINPANQNVYYLGRADDAFSIMRQQGVGISNSNLAKIPVAIGPLTGSDIDKDGLSDDFEVAIGANPSEKDSDNDGYDDGAEMNSNYDPNRAGRLNYDLNFAKTQSGKIFLQVENKGQAWYVNPADNKRYFLGRPADAYQVMRKLGLGISNKDLGEILKD